MHFRFILLGEIRTLGRRAGAQISKCSEPMNTAALVYDGAPSCSCVTDDPAGLRFIVVLKRWVCLGQLADR